MRGLAHGQVWWADLEKVRPVIVLTRGTVAPLLRRVLVAPITSTVRGIGCEVPLGPDEGVADGSVANLDNIQLVDVQQLLRTAGHVSPARWPEFCTAMSHTLGC